MLHQDQNYIELCTKIRIGIIFSPLFSSVLSGALSSVAEITSSRKKTIYQSFFAHCKKLKEAKKCREELPLHLNRKECELYVSIFTPQ